MAKRGGRLPYDASKDLTLRRQQIQGSLDHAEANRGGTGGGGGEDVVFRFLVDTNKAVNSLKNFVQAFNKTVDGVLNALNPVNIGSQLASAIDTLVNNDVTDYIKEATMASVDYVETLNLFNVAMGKNKKQANEYVRAMAELYGLNPKNLFDTMGGYYLLADAMGVSSEAAYKLSAGSTKLANDLASLYNVNLQKTQEKISSGLQGQTRAVRSLGMDIRVATIEQTALNLGFKENITTTSEANRIILRYITMVEQAHKATTQLATAVDGSTQVFGDWAATIEAPANQIRVFQEQIAYLTNTIGNIFVPVLAKVLPILNGIIMAVRTIIQFFNALFGITTKVETLSQGFATDFENAADAVGTGAGGLGGAADKTAKKLNRLLAPFDELNILAENAADNFSGAFGGTGAGIDLGAVDPELLKALEAIELHLENIPMKAREVANAITEFLGFDFDPFSGDITWDLSKLVDNLHEAFDNIPGMEALIDKFAQNFATASAGENIGRALAIAVNGGLGLFAQWISWDNVGEDVSKAMQPFITAINTFFEDFDPKNFGTAFGEFWNTVTHALEVFIDGVSWPEIGKKIGSAIDQSIKKVDWGLTGTVIGKAITAASEFINNIVKAIDFTDLGAKLATAVNNIITNTDWKAVGESISNKFVSILDTISSFLFNLDISEVVAGAIDFATSTGGRLARSLINFAANIVWALVRAIGSLIVEVPKAIVEGITNNIDKTEAYQEYLETCESMGIEAVAAVDLGMNGEDGTKAKSLGEAFTTELENGLVDNGQVKASFEQFGTDLSDALAVGMGYNSSTDTESKTFKDLGSNSANSIAQGVEADRVKVTTAFNGMYTNVMVETNVFGEKLTRAVDETMNGDSSGKQGVVNTIETAQDTIEQSTKDFKNNTMDYMNELQNGVTGVARRVNKLMQDSIKDIGMWSSNLSNPTALASLGASLTLNWLNAKPMATGGVVSGPTNALIGEGLYKEAVIPLGDSPEMKDMLKQFASMVNGNNNNQNVNVKVYIGDKEWDTFTYESAQRGQRALGAQPIRLGGVF